MSDIWLSIVVPVFNTPKDDMDRLFSSLTNQTMQGYKVIIINDGSDEKCGKYLENLEKQYDYIELYTISNSGVSNARNYGIEKVNTPYIAFADADDEYSITFVEEAAEYVKKYKPDIIYGVMKLQPERPWNQSRSYPELFESEDGLLEIKKSLLAIKPRELEYQIPGTPCARLYRTDIASQNRFRSEIKFYEDQIFNRECLKQAKKVLVVPNCWYTYYQNDYSAMHLSRRENFYRKTRTYWDAFFELNQQEPKDILVCLRIEVLDNDYVQKKIIPRRKGEFDEAVSHPMIQDSLQNLKVFSDPMKIMDRINILLLKNHMYKTMYLKKRILNWIGFEKMY